MYPTFSLTLSIHYQIIWPEEGQAEGVVKVKPADTENFVQCYIFGRVKIEGENSAQLPEIWNFQTSFYSSNEALVEAIRQRITQDWKVRR